MNKWTQWTSQIQSVVLNLSGVISHQKIMKFPATCETLTPSFGIYQSPRKCSQHFFRYFEISEIGLFFLSLLTWIWDRMVFVFSRILTESRICPYARKYRYDFVLLRGNTDQRKLILQHILWSEIPSINHLVKLFSMDNVLNRISGISF